MMPPTEKEKNFDELLPMVLDEYDYSVKHYPVCNSNAGTYRYPLDIPYNGEKKMGLSYASRNDPKNPDRIQTLHPLVRIKARKHLELCDLNNIHIRITHGERTFAEQDMLYALGRTSPGKIVTNAKGGQSWHNFCLAYDVVILDYINNRYVANWDTRDPRWDKVGELGVQAGMEWPIRIGSGNKKWIDYPHFQYRFDNLTIAEARELWNRGILHTWKGIM